MIPGGAIVKDLVLVGGGHAHVAVLRRFGMKPLRGVRLTLIARDIETPYSGMLPGFVAGHYRYNECHIDLGPLAMFAGARLYHDEAIGIDRTNKRVLCAGRPPVAYDVLSLDIGSRPRQHDVPGSTEYATPVKPIDTFAARWAKIVARVTADDRPLRIGVVGGGAGGVELTLAMQHRLRGLLRGMGQNPDRLTFVLVTANGLLPTHNSRVSKIFHRVFGERGIELHTDTPVSAVEAGRVLAGDKAIALDEILWVTQAGAASWLRESGFDCDEGGFVRVRDTLQTLTDPAVFAAGDVAAVIDHPRPKAGVFAVRQGPPLADNLRRAAAGETPQPFIPQRRFLSLISTGDRYAVASRGAWATEGTWLWTAKDWIDRRFMGKYGDLPAMPASTSISAPAPGVADTAALQELSAIAMRCGGCGAKVGSSVLSRVMARLEVVQREDVVVGLDAPDDAAIVRAVPGKAMVHTVDYFRSFIDDPFVFGRIAANHSLGDIYAMGGEPQSALAVATVPYGIEAKVEDDLFQMMSGALTVLNEANTALVGGHTSEGAELALGFAITGAIGENEALRKGGLRPGQALILTKPVGTGTLFAAAMRRQAKGPWIDTALASMQVSAREAAGCLRRWGATACTDVTGFGLLGHLVEMTKPSEVDAELRIGALPVLPGAIETIRAGIFSSLQPQNVRLRRAIEDAGPLRDDPRYALLFDPQTAGGLLAGVPEGVARDCVAELQRLGYPAAAVIGCVLPTGAGAAPIRVVV